MDGLNRAAALSPHRPPFRFKESFPVFTKLLEYMRDMGYSAMSAQYSRTLAWGTSDTIPKDAASIKAFVEDGWMTTNVWFALRRT